MENKRITFGYYANQIWLPTKKMSCEEATSLMYRQELSHFELIDNVPIEDITYSMLRTILAGSWRNRRKCEKMKTTLSQVFESACQDRIINFNPARKLELPKKKISEKRILTSEEKDAVRAARLTPRERLAVDCLYCMGLRPEELRALSEDEFDLTERKCTISRAAAVVGGKMVLKGTKNGKERTLPISEDLKTQILAIGFSREGYLFPGREGGLMTCTEYRNFYESIMDKIAKQLGLKSRKEWNANFYIFRHSFCTELYYSTLRKQITIKAAASLCGNTPSLFINTYSHVDEERENIDDVIINIRI